jgi:pimeloyl-ACP methyl ester carboxylesterase
VHIARAGHLSPVEQPDAVNQAIREFLKATARR